MTDLPFDRDRLDRFFDGELSAHEERELLSDARRVDGAYEELAKTRRAIELLHEPVETPDMLQEILGKVEARRGFLPPKWRRVVSVGRVAAAVVLLACVGAVAMVQRTWPEATTWTPEPRPISAVVESGQSEATLCVREFVDGLGEIASLAPVLPVSDSCQPLRLSDGDNGLPVVRVVLDRSALGQASSGRVLAVGWGNASDLNADGLGHGGEPARIVYTGAMPFEVLDGSGRLRLLNSVPGEVRTGGWVVPEELIRANESAATRD